jgi:putative spermidine/putrescine transport system permease protein
MTTRWFGVAQAVGQYTALTALFLFAFLPTLVGTGYSLLSSIGWFRPSATSRFSLDYFSLDFYYRLFSSGDFFSSLIFTLGIAVSATLISYLLALALAITLRTNTLFNRWSRLLVQYTLPFPHLAAASLVILFFAQSGLAARLLFSLGIIDSTASFPELIFDKFGVGILLTYVWKETPFLTVALLGVMESVGAKYEAVAESLGAGRTQQIRYVLLPLLLRGTLPSLLLLFAFLIGAFETPLLVGSLYPPMLSVLTYQRFSQANAELRGDAFALSCLILAMMTGLIFFYQRLRRESQ